MKEIIFRSFVFAFSFLAGTLIIYFMGSLIAWSANPANWTEELRGFMFGFLGFANFLISIIVQDGYWDILKNDK